MSILKKGMRGAPVKRLQEKLGIAADGIYGPGTAKAVQDFQTSAGLAADGIAGPDTFTALGLEELILLRVGVAGEAVKKLQAALGLAADGRFGPATEQAVKDFQTANGLSVDGMAGPETLARLDTFDKITEETVAKATVRPDETQFEAEPMPAMKAMEVIAGPTAEAPAETSVWGRVKGWFS